MLLGQGLEVVFARQRRWSQGVRAAVAAWRLPTPGADPKLHAPVLTRVVAPKGVDAEAVRCPIHARLDLSRGTGLGKAKGRMFRIGHTGDINDLTLVAALGGVGMGQKLSGVPLAGSGVAAATAHFAAHPAPTAADAG
jgi:alanine-glyoxylate transaminase/serine-glyoxylate transaminase/serine-pyruvate transaminase